MHVVRRKLRWLPGALALGLLLLCAATVDRPGPARFAATARGELPASAAPVKRVAAVGGRVPAARPRIVPRGRWLAGAETYHRDPVRYGDRVKAVFLHHTDSPNDYDCADAPRIIRYLYAGQAGGGASGGKEWDDIGYNFLVDRCGTVYEGRAGGIGRPVIGAHAQGFNRNTAGIAAIGTFTEGTPVPKAMTDAIAAVAAWKLGLSGIDPRSHVRLVSSNDLARFRAGTAHEFSAVSGHRDGYETFCPGLALMGKLPEIRERAAALQNRR
ncbi:peptidoglycan recognition protein family protein [Streptomyces endophyticus]|uniref:Peptidoglycan recognition protein n=1 Tax=Streptomyces endophyticus TaxID=714166 RepID=A0ABU6FGK4_9ACTN|nr:peptidoglycan recognition protein [Streptomyces endophyticus]MEB8343181.1 peptidoglycan recognition protein [Streptomyces endophyticus]